MTNICNFCDKEFKTYTLLKRHMKSIKCLKLQGITIEKNAKIFKCESCFRVLQSKRNYTNHLSICKVFILDCIKNKELENLKIEISAKDKELQISNAKLDCMKEIAKEPKTKTTNINTINNKYINMVPLVFKKSDVKSRIETDFNKNHFLEGQEGVAKCVYNSFLLDEHGKSKYIITNMNKGVFLYKDKNGEIQKDIKAYRLTDIVANDIIDKSKYIYDENQYIINKDLIPYYQNSFIDIKNLKNNNSAFVNTLVKLNGCLQSENQSSLEEYEEEYEYVICNIR